jgi:hypothetical protein
MFSLLFTHILEANNSICFCPKKDATSNRVGDKETSADASAVF